MVEDSRKCIIITFLIVIILVLIVVGIIYFVKNISSIIIKDIYKKYFFKLWPIVSKSPKLLNAAFPDFTIQYFMMSFPKNCEIEIIGKIPISINFFSIVFYDINGIPIQSWNDSEFSDNLYNIDYTTTQESSLIVRYYTTITPNNIYPILPSFLPQINILNTPFNTKEWVYVSDKEIIQNSANIEKMIYKIIGKQNYNFSNVNKNTFFLPNPSSLNMLFPNPDAMYLMCFPNSNNVIRIEGILPSSIGKDNNIRYIGFMACNLSNSSTNSCISATEMTHQYVLYIAYNELDAKKFGYQKSNHNLLLWDSETNSNPVVIYRQVQINSTGLFYYQNATSNINGIDIEKVMNPYYPSVTTF